MKKLLVLLILCCCLTGPLFSATERLYQTISTYYRIYSNVSEEYTVEIAEKMEACLKLFNEIFHFDLSTLEVKLKVVIYADQTSFDAYLNKLLGKTRSDFVYIHYSDLVKSELVGYQKDDEETFNSLLIHQGLIQFLKAFAPSAPMWLQEGVAAYMESSTYNREAKSFTLEKNLAWLSTLKTIIRGEGESAYLNIAELITITKDAAITRINTFYPEVWGLVYFLMNSPENKYNRLLTDSIQILDPELTMQENSLLIKNRVFSWIDSKTLENDFISFIQSLKTFQDHIQDGINHYAAKEYAKAETSFTAAKEIRPTDYFAYYYLGLIAYSNKEYYNAEQYYLKALSLGAEAALTNYALGVNAYADNEFDTAETYLKEARKINSEKYWEKVEEILERIEAENLYSEGEIYLDTPESDMYSGTTTDKTPGTTSTEPTPPPTTDSTETPPEETTRTPAPDTSAQGNKTTDTVPAAGEGTPAPLEGEVKPGGNTESETDASVSTPGLTDEAGGGTGEEPFDDVP